MEKFKLSHVTLYAKGWYLKSDDIWEDLKKILKLDDYTPFTKMDVYSIILSATQNSNIYRWTELKEVLNGIHPSNCWKVGYYVKENADWAHKDTKINEYDMPTAFIYYVISNLRFIETKYWIPTVPKYKLYPKPKHISLQKVIEQFNFKKAS